MAGNDRPATGVTMMRVMDLPDLSGVAIVIETPDYSHTLAIDSSQVAALITALITRLSVQQTPEAQQLLRMFCIHNIEVAHTPEGLPCLQYEFENGLVCGTGLTHAEIAMLHAGLGRMLSN